MESYRDFLKEIEDFIFVEDAPEKSDVIFIPGNGYPHMAEQAAELYKEGYAPYVLPSGKYSVTNGCFSGVLAKREKYEGVFETEWEFLRTVLLKNQVPDTAILREDQATFTYENAMYSRQVTDREGLAVKKAILCCKACHGRRCKMYYEHAYPGTKFFVCTSDVDGITKENWNCTEEGVQSVMGELQRIIRQFSLMMPAEQEKM